MRLLGDLSINARLNLLVLIAGGVALLLACGALALNDYLVFRASKVQQLSSLAAV